MKTGIHPKYFESVEIRCSCGNVIIAGSTKESMKTELCSKCHPFYTGQQKLVDTAGRVDKFAERMKKSAAMKEEAVHRKEAKKKKPEEYQEKVIPAEAIEKAMSGKWGGPIGDSPAEQVVKEEIAEAKKAKSAKKTSAKKPATAKKSVAKPKTPPKKVAVKKKSVKK